MYAMLCIYWKYFAHNIEQRTTGFGLVPCSFGSSHLIHSICRFGAKLAWYKYILSIHIANNSIRMFECVRCWAAQNEQAATIFFCSLFKVPLCMNIIVAIMRCCCCRTLTKAIDKIYTHYTLTHKQQKNRQKLHSNQKHSIPFGLENWLIYLFVESTEKSSR